MVDANFDWNEKRQDSRVNFDLPVFFYFAAGKRRPREVNYHKGYTQNVSKSGLRLLIERPSDDAIEKLQNGTELELEIYLPAVFRSKPITARGRVVWCHPMDDPENMLAGVDFIHLDDKNRDTLKQVAGTLREVTDDILGGPDETAAEAIGADGELSPTATSDTEAPTTEAPPETLHDDLG